MSESISETYIYSNTPFKIVAVKQETKPGCWNTHDVSVFKNEVHIGSYVRTYDSFIKDTFCPFKVNNTWYALYSDSYTKVRVAKIDTTFELWWESEDDFCPVEFLVPEYFTSTYKATHRAGLPVEPYDKEIETYFDNEYKTKEEFIGESNGREIFYKSWALLSGCYWGDDTSWKIRYIDFSKIEEKNILITEKFGYYELGATSIRKALTIDSERYICLKTKFFFDLRHDYEIQVIKRIKGKVLKCNKNQHKKKFKKLLSSIPSGCKATLRENGQTSAIRT